MTWVTRARRQDAPALARVIYRSIHDGATLYTKAERRAWMPRRPDPARFARRLAPQTVWVARRAHGPVGFVTVKTDGYVDLAYLLPSALGQGLFRALMSAAIAAQAGPMSTHASLHAQPAFASMGFKIDHHEVVRQRGQRLRRAKMTRT